MNFNRLAKSAVVWSWLFNTLRLSTGLILLPLVMWKFTKDDFGMYGVLIQLGGLVPVIDFGFGPTIGRFVSYAYGGAKTLSARGLQTPAITGSPNYALLWELLDTTRALYRYITLIILLILGVWGTYTVELKIHDTSSVLITRLAWYTTLLAAGLDMYWSWWNTYLNGMNQVVTAARIGTMAMGVRFVLSVGLLLGGAGLLSLPIASLVGSLLERQLARAFCLKLLPPRIPSTNPNAFWENMRIIWPNNWRLGVQFLSNSLLDIGVLSCLNKFALATMGQYIVSTKMIGIAGSMAAVWTQTKWPLIGQYQAQHEFARLRQVLWPRVWLQTATFLALATGVVLVGPTLLRQFGHGKEMLPFNWMLVLVAQTFCLMHFSLWTTLITTGNRLPYLWYTVATNAISLILSLSLVVFTNLGLGSFLLGPLIAGSLYNYWRWPFVAARGIGTTLFHFLFRGPGEPLSRPG